MKGTVKNFKKDRGFGFIKGEDGKDYFFHYSEIQAEGYRSAEPGEEVEFEPSDGDRGLRASKVVKIADAPAKAE